MRIEWMLAQQPQGEALGTRAIPAPKYRDSEFLRLRESWCRLIEDQGLQYNFVSYGQVEQGELLRRGYKVLVLPRSTRAFGGGGERDPRVRGAGRNLDRRWRAGRVRRALPATCESRSLADLFEAGGSGRGKAIRLTADILSYHQDRLVGKEGHVHRMIGELSENRGRQTAVRRDRCVGSAGGRRRNTHVPEWRRVDRRADDEPATARR